MKAISKFNYSTILSCHTSTNFNIRCILSVLQVCLGGSIIDPTKLSFHSRNKGDSWGKNHANSSKENDSGLETRNDSEKQGRSIILLRSCPGFSLTHTKYHPVLVRGMQASAKGVFS